MDNVIMMVKIKKMADYFNQREDELGKVLSGEKVYFLNDGYTILEEMIYALYDLDESDWNDDLIFRYLFGMDSLDHFERFIVKKGGSYDMLRGLSDRVWRELSVIEGGSHE